MSAGGIARPGTGWGAGLRAGLLAAAALTLAACSDDGPPTLEGERVALRTAPPEAAMATTRPIPPARTQDDWTQSGGGADRPGGHLTAPTAPALAWNVDAGAPIARSLRPSGPVVTDGRVFVRDGAGAVLAFEAGSGRSLWRADLTPSGERGAAGHGGGLAADGGRLFATTGFGEVVALNPASGERLWTHRAEAPFGAPPAAAEGLVIAVTRGGEALGLSAEDGGVLWRAASGLDRSGNLPGAAAAITQGVAAVPFGSGEIQLVRANRGVRIWAGALFSSGAAQGLGMFSDVTSDPVPAPGPAGPVIVAGNAGGALGAWDGRSGRPLWQRTFGSLSPVWVAGDTLFAATTEPRLVRLDLATGATLWATDLPTFRRPDRREGPITYAGPVLAGGRLLVTTSEGALLSFDPATGTQLSEVDLPGGSSTGPVVAGGTIYVLNDRGRLLAFR